MKSIKVSELNKYIKKYLSMDYLLNDISVEGEISNLRRHGNGNYYFSLKDEYAHINTIMFREHATNLPFTPYDGLKIIAKGSVSFYESHAQINFYIREMEEAGEGDLYRKYLMLKKKLEKEGLFSPRNKKEISLFPKSVGIVTSGTGAAVKDIINIIREKNKMVDLYIYPSLVQGKEASKDLINGIEYFNSHPVDTIIIGRGGGSFEDLYSFNDESLAYAIYHSKIPIISAVGHEIDFSISDFVADIRAATPSKAAEIVTISQKDIHQKLEGHLQLLCSQMDAKLKQKHAQLYSKISFLKLLNPGQKLIHSMEGLDYLNQKLSHAFHGKLKESWEALIRTRNRFLFTFRSRQPDRNLKTTKVQLDQSLSQILIRNNFYLKDQKKYFRIYHYEILKRIKFEKDRVLNKKEKFYDDFKLIKSMKRSLENNRFQLDYYFKQKILYHKKLLFFKFQMLRQTLLFSRRTKQMHFRILKQKVQEITKTIILDTKKDKVKLIKSSFQKINLQQMIDTEKSRLKNIQKELKSCWNQQYEQKKEQLQLKELRLERAYQSRGKIDIHLKDGTKLKSIHQLSVDDHITITFEDGEAKGKIIKINNQR
ncbi:MAG: exodeoxyribonuclease VII large subunit [Tissierellia bacterium]|nr:exodeoxyribonuclease VII large subunit [Tissierellia bacterium]